MEKTDKNVIRRLLSGLSDDKIAGEIPESPDAEELLQELWQRSDADHGSATMEDERGQIWEKITRLTTTSKGKSRLMWTKVAAAIILPLILATSAYFFLNLSHKDRSSTMSWQTVEGERSRFVMNDGTVVWLNSGSALHFSQKGPGRTREAILTGEAYFEVAHNRTPFIVRSGNSKVEVLGTTFNLNAYPDIPKIEVTLVEGSVKYHSGNKQGDPEYLLKPGEKATTDRQTGQTTVARVNTGFYTSWIEGKLSFDNQPLEEIAELLQKRYQQQVTVSPELSGLYRYTLTIKDESLPEVLLLLQITSPIEFEEKQEGYIIRKRKGK